MKQSNFLIFFTVVVLITAVGALLVPETFLAQYGFAVNPASTLLMRYLGVQFVLEGLLAWFARNVSELDAQRAIFLAYFIASALGAVVSLLGALIGTLNVFGWLNVG